MRSLTSYFGTFQTNARHFNLRKQLGCCSFAIRIVDTRDWSKGRGHSSNVRMAKNDLPDSKGATCCHRCSRKSPDQDHSCKQQQRSGTLQIRIQLGSCSIPWKRAEQYHTTLWGFAQKSATPFDHNGGVSQGMLMPRKSCSRGIN